MHHALLIEEVVLDIFSHLSNSDTRTLARLASTCTAFKEPALNTIWAALDNLTPLVRCLPPDSWDYEDGFESASGDWDPDDTDRYSLNRPLEQTDWDIILAYTRRVRALPRLRAASGLAENSIKALSNPPPSTQIFPNLRVVGITKPTADIAPFVRHLINPRVKHVLLIRTGILGTAVRPFGSGCPFVTSFSFVANSNSNDMLSDLVCHWQHLRTVSCYGVSPNVDALSHLSRLRTLLSLRLHVQRAVVAQIHAPGSPTPTVTFSALRCVHLKSLFSATIIGLIGHFRLPAIRDFTVSLIARPSPLDLVSLFETFQEACTHSSLNTLVLRHRHCQHRHETFTQDSPPYYITFDCLRPLTVFGNIKDISLDMNACGVDMNERELLALASSWPHLEKFEVGRDYDWAPSSGITPEGFLRLLERCRSLQEFYFMFDTRGYIAIPQGHPWRGLAMPTPAFIDVLNSPIEEASIHALGVFFHVAGYPNFELRTEWNDPEFRGRERPRELCQLYHDRWGKVCELARGLWEERSVLRRCLETARAVS